ncbi:MAG: hypothetical protein V1859_02625 [archaeon]
MIPKITTIQKYYPFNLKKYFTIRNGLLLLLLFVLYLFIPKYVQAITLMIIFYPICLFTVKTTKYVKNMGIETLTTFSIFLGYLYGWQIAMFFGLVIGGYIWSQAGLVTKTLVQILMTGFAGYLGYWVHGLTWLPNFFWAYIFAVTIRNILTFVIFIPVNPEPVANFMHLVSDIVWNTLILSTFINMLYNLIMLISF